MVFVGYGMSIPEAGWDDFEGLDLHGKIAVYVNAFPPVKVSDNVKSHVNTADERWLALKRAGAIGVATIARRGRRRRRMRASPHTIAVCRAMLAARRRSRARRSQAEGRAAARRSPSSRWPIAIWTTQPARSSSITLTARGAAAILAGSGHTIEEINQLVTDNKPLPRFALPGTLKAHAALKRDPIESTNVAGVFEGSDPALKSEYVIMSAHLDHLGVGRAVNGDTIYNGAMDDASGIASVIETARLLKASGVKTKRSVLFLAVTAEEKRRARIALLRRAPDRPVPADRRRHQPRHVPAAVCAEGDRSAGPGRIVARRLGARGREDARRRRADGSRTRAEPVHPERSVQLHPRRAFRRWRSSSATSSARPKRRRGATGCATSITSRPTTRSSR